MQAAAGPDGGEGRPLPGAGGAGPRAGRCGMGKGVCFPVCIKRWLGFKGPSTGDILRVPLLSFYACPLMEGEEPALGWGTGREEPSCPVVAWPLSLPPQPFLYIPEPVTSSGGAFVS